MWLGVCTCGLIRGTCVSICLILIQARRDTSAALQHDHCIGQALIPCRFIAVRTCTQDKKRGGIYEAPCYRVKTRKGFNFITTFSLRTEEDKAKWTLRGVALLCSID